MSVPQAPPTNWEAVTAIATAVAGIATLLAVAVALFNETFWRWVRRPILTGSVRRGAPDCHLTPVRISSEEPGIFHRDTAYWFRIWVENKGRGSAEQVEVFAARLLRRNDEGVFLEKPQFMPMNLLWTHTQEVYAPRISPQMGRHCEIGRVLKSNPQHFELLLVVAPYTQWHLLGPGTYRLELRIAAANAGPKRVTLEIIFAGGWNDDQDVM